jgi:2-hydroxychromene-2-carboxylate isomerase
MRQSIDYYFTPQSPWTYLGHARLCAMARAANAEVRLRPVDFGAVFPISGGLPLAKRAPQRQAYRLVELRRWSAHLGIPLNLQPKYFPVAGDPAALLMIAIDQHDGSDAALKFCAAVFEALWVHEQNIADPVVLAALLAACGLASERAKQATGADIRALYDGYTQEAIAAQVFGAPTYVLNGELYWGQDRLDFLQRALDT